MADLVVPRSLLLESRVLERLGRLEEARAALARLEDLLSQADPDFPLLAEARTLRRKLGPGSRVAATAPDPGGRNPKGGDDGSEEGSNRRGGNGPAVPESGPWSRPQAGGRPMTTTTKCPVDVLLDDHEGGGLSRPC